MIYAMYFKIKILKKEKFNRINLIRILNTKLNVKKK